MEYLCLLKKSGESEISKVNSFILFWLFDDDFWTLCSFSCFQKILRRSYGYLNNQLLRQICLNIWINMVWPKIIQSNIFQRFGNNLNFFWTNSIWKGIRLDMHVYSLKEERVRVRVWNIRFAKGTWIGKHIYLLESLKNIKINPIPNEI